MAFSDQLGETGVPLLSPQSTSTHASQKDLIFIDEKD